MKRLSFVIPLLRVAIVVGGVLAGAQQSRAAQNGLSRVSPTVWAARQNTLDSALHQRVVAARGKLVEAHDAKVADLAEDLPSLMTRSDEVVLVHLVTSYGGVSASGNSVLSHYDVQVLRSWKGSHVAGDLVTIFVPAGGLLFPDGTQAGRRVRGFSPLRCGGRYVLFLRSSSRNSKGAPSLWLVGDGVQGAFLLGEEKVHPVYEQGALWKTYNRHDVPAFLAELDGLSAQHR